MCIIVKGIDVNHSNGNFVCIILKGLVVYHFKGD